MKTAGRTTTRGFRLLPVLLAALAGAAVLALPHPLTAQSLEGQAAPRRGGTPAGRRIRPKVDTFQIGDVFVGSGGGRVEWHKPDGRLVKTLNSGFPGSETTGMTFDTDGRLYLTLFQDSTVVIFDNTGEKVGTFGSGFNAHCESILFDANQDVYVGQADGTGDVLKFNKAGTRLATFDVARESRGSDHIDLAADQKTLFYTSEGRRVKRFDVQANRQLADFATLPGGTAFALRVFKDGGVLVASTDAIRLLDPNGTVLRTYDDPDNRETWFATNLDADGRTFWSAGFSTGKIFRFNLNTGQIVSSFQADRVISSVAGLAVFGERRAAIPEGIEYVSGPFSMLAGETGTFTVQANEVKNEERLGEPLASAKILIDVASSNTGDQTFKRSLTTAANGQASFPFAPTFAGLNDLRATLDENGNGRRDEGEPVAIRQVISTIPRHRALQDLNGSGNVGTAACAINFRADLRVVDDELVGVQPHVDMRIPRRNFRFESTTIQGIFIENEDGSPGPRRGTMFGIGKVNGAGAIPFRADFRDLGTTPGVRKDDFVVKWLQDTNGDGVADILRQGGKIIGPATGNATVLGPETNES